jgi:adenylate cyclase
LFCLLLSDLDLFREEEIRAERTKAVFHLGFAAVVAVLGTLIYTAPGLAMLPTLTVVGLGAVAVALMAAGAGTILWLIARGRYHPSLMYVTSGIEMVVVGALGLVVAVESRHFIGVFTPAFKTPAWYLLTLLALFPAFRYSERLAAAYGGGTIAILSVWTAQAVLSGEVSWSPRPGDDLIGPHLNWAMMVMRYLILGLIGFAVWTVCRNSRRVVRRAVEVQVGLATEEFRRARMQESVSRYFPPHISAAIAAGDGLEGLGGERRQVVVLMSDIRNFTTATEDMDPEQVVRELNLYFSEMVDVLFRTGGTLLQLSGDGLFAVYGLPDAAPDDARRAVQAAAEMGVRLDALKARGAFPGLGDLRIGVGIHRGEAVVGNIGSPQRMEFTAIGDAVNTANRVESLNKELGTTVLVTEEVLAALGPDREQFEPMGEHHVKGKAHLVRVHALRAA